eukprot:5496231-Amphidinium_carterae.1
MNPLKNHRSEHARRKRVSKGRATVTHQALVLWRRQTLASTKHPGSDRAQSQKGCCIDSIVVSKQCSNYN